MEPKDYVTIAIALIGSITGIIALWRTIKKEGRKIRVQVKPSFYAYADGNLSTQLASIEVVNDGQRTVTVKAPSLRMPNGQHLSFVRAKGFENFPKKLEDGEKVATDVRFREIADALKAAGYEKGKVKMYPSCLDATGKRYWGEAWELDVDIRPAPCPGKRPAERNAVWPTQRTLCGHNKAAVK